MLTRDDLDEAVARGIVDRPQAVKLLALGQDRVERLRRAAGGDERFVFMRNFNELFVAIGCALVGMACFFGMALGYATIGPLVFIPGLGLLWGLAELLTGRLRLTLPSIVIAVFLVVLAALAVNAIWLGALDPFRYGRMGLLGWPAINGAGAALAAASIFYWRFRLPFALLLIAAAATALQVSVLNSMADAPIFTRPAMLVAGMACFAAGMWYDLSDRQRLSRRADCAFWLHLIAGPLIVHSVVISLWPAGPLSASTAVAILAMMALFALVALVVDRRALLVSSLAYIGMTMSWGFSALGSGTQSLLATFLLLGGGVIVLGIGWQSVRRLVLAWLPATMVTRLPQPKT
jgi:hypothetical protein